MEAAAGEAAAGEEEAVGVTNNLSSLKRNIIPSKDASKFEASFVFT